MIDGLQSNDFLILTRKDLYTLDYYKKINHISWCSFKVLNKTMHSFKVLLFYDNKNNIKIIGNNYSAKTYPKFYKKATLKQICKAYDITNIVDFMNIFGDVI